MLESDRSSKSEATTRIFTSEVKKPIESSFEALSIGSTINLAINTAQPAASQKNDVE